MHEFRVPLSYRYSLRFASFDSFSLFRMLLIVRARIMQFLIRSNVKRRNVVLFGEFHALFGK